jgi:phage-related protein
VRGKRARPGLRRSAVEGSYERSGGRSGFGDGCALSTLSAPGDEGPSRVDVNSAVGYAETGIRDAKPLFWVASCRDDSRSFPIDVQRVVGFALYQAQIGRKHLDAKPLRGSGGASVLEIVEDHCGNTYRAVYTVRLQGAVCALHAFQKKSKTSISTPKREIELVLKRLKFAADHYAEGKSGQE